VQDAIGARICFRVFRVVRSYSPGTVTGRSQACFCPERGPECFEALTGQGSAVGDIGRSAALAREVLYAILSVDYYENTQHQVGRRI